jgi:hypothetical protein
MKHQKLVVGLGLAAGLAALAMVVRAEIPSAEDTPSTPIPVAAAGAPAVAAAAAPPAPAQAPAPPQPGDNQFRMMGPGRWMGGRLNPNAWTQADWDDTAAFLKEHSPRRLDVVNSLGDGRGEYFRKMRLQNFFVNTYRNIQRLKKDDPELAGAVTRRVELEDMVFGLTGQYREAKKKGDTARQASIRHDLADTVSDLVDTNIKERQLRIARLERTLKQEQDRLAADTKSRDQFVEKRLNNLLDGRTPDDDRGEVPATDSQAPTAVGSAQQP